MFSRLLAGSTIALSVGNAVAAGVAWGGVNIAGFDFGCTTDGTCLLGNVVPPVDATAQMKHFVEEDKLNAFRLPVGWQYLVNDQLGATLHAGNLAKYDGLVQSCLSTGAYCIVDIHNYARWNGQIIGQGGPTDDDFTSVWSQLATKYAAESKIVMGLMNEPHDMPDMTRWTTSVQAAVTAIRKAGATTQTILLPGNGYTGAGTFATGSGPALSKVTNLDGSTTNLIFDVHQYLDADNSGTHANCVGNQIDKSFAPLATWLRENKRQALLSETGGGSSDSSCLKYMCEALDFINTNSDVYLGFLGWSAGSFSPSSYTLSLTPMAGMTDQLLMKQCFAGKFSGEGGAPGPAPGPSSYPASSAPGPSAPATSMPAYSAPASTAAPESTTSAPYPSASASASNSTSGSIPVNRVANNQYAESDSTQPTTTDSSPAAGPTTGFPINPKIASPSDVFPPGRSSTTDSAPYPTSEGFQTPASSYGTGVPTTFSTRVKPTSTEEAGPEETGDGEPDDETCEA